MPLFDEVRSDGIMWVYYPHERVLRRVEAWRCDMMWITAGDATVGCRSDVYFSVAYLSNLRSEPPSV